MKRLIFGCGYVGKRAGQAWADAGDTVFGVTRKKSRFAELESIGIRPILGDVTNPASLADIPLAETVLVAIGMDRSTYSDIRQVYVEGLSHILDSLPSKTGHLIYISSTGVYGDFGGDWVDEQSKTEPQRDGGRACLAAEQLILGSQFSDCYTILRFAGIYGKLRIPMRSAIAEKDWSRLSAEGHLNLIHVDDGVGVIRQVAKQKTLGQTFLVGDGNPTLRKDYYETVATFLGTGPIDWSVQNPSGNPRSRSDKRVSNAKLRDQINHVLQYPDYRIGLKNAFQAGD